MPSINTELGERALSKMHHEMDWRPLKERCLRVYPTWSSRHVDRILREYQRFLALKVATRDVHDTIVLAPLLLDAMWKQHILSTQQYYADCQLLLQTNQVLHYNADAPINVGRTVREKRMELTKASLCMMFAGSTLSTDAKGIWDYYYQHSNEEGAGAGEYSASMDSALSSIGEDDGDDEREHLEDIDEEEEETDLDMPPPRSRSRSRSPRKGRTRNSEKDNGNNNGKAKGQSTVNKASKQTIEAATEKRRILYIYRAGKVSKLGAHPHDTILHIKAKIHRKIGVPPQQQFLEWDGLELVDDKRTIAHYGIPNDATLVLTKVRNIPSHPSIHTDSLIEKPSYSNDEDHHRHHHHHQDSSLVEERDDPDVRHSRRRGRSSPATRSIVVPASKMGSSRPPKPPRQQPPSSPTPYSPSDDSYADPRQRQQALLNKIKIHNHHQAHRGDDSSMEQQSTLARSRPKSAPPSGPPKPLKVFINTIMGFTINLTAMTHDTVHRLKEMIEEQEDIPFSKQILILDGVPLEDSQLLIDYANGNDPSSLHVLLRLQAGSGSVMSAGASSISPSSTMATAVVTRKKNQNKLLARRSGM